jgi:hypothetical protein
MQTSLHGSAWGFPVLLPAYRNNPGELAVLETLGPREDRIDTLEALFIDL